MPADFYIDYQHNIKVGYDNLLSDLNETESFNPFCLSDDYYFIFKSIIISLLIDEPICLLDHDFSKSEIKFLTGVDNYENVENKHVSLEKILSADDLIERIRSVRKWKVILFTSGTTGTPKKVSHDFLSITRRVKASEKHNYDIWGFAYSPAHIAGLQVFFQALLNKNTIVRLFGLSSEMIISSIINERVTHISATPTFYRLMLPIEEKITTVRRITSGGEKLDATTIQKLKAAFINAVILNVYASTEAGTIMASENEIFSVTAENSELVKIVDQELYVHTKLLGESDAFKLAGDWYPTNDLVEIISESPLKFRFISRKNEMINVGGYKVNPQEVEQVLLTIEDIKDAYVYPRKNSVLGNIVCADIVSIDKSISIPEILNILRSSIQEFKIPRIINFVDSIKYSNTGKKIRQ